MPVPVVLLSSGGKDSLAALYALREDPQWDVQGLITTFNEVTNRVAMHGTRRDLMQAQADALSLPLTEVDLPENCSNEDYEDILAGTLRRFQAAGIAHVAFGDLFLEDIREYRNRQNGALGMEAVFPIWGRDGLALALELIDAGCEITVTCVDADQLDPAFLGRRLDRAFLDALPDGVDPCGENGEFHTFVSNGQGFGFPIEAEPGEVVVANGRFHFLDLAADREASSWRPEHRPTQDRNTAP